MGEDWLGRHRIQLKFNPAVLLVFGVYISLGRVPNEPVLVVVDTDKKLPSGRAISGRGRLVTKRKLEGKIFQIAPVGKYSPKEKEVALCEVVVLGAEVVPIMLTNQSVRISKGE